VNQLGGSSFLTEFGGCDDSPTCDDQLNWALKNADIYFQSWAYWGSVYGDMATVKLLSRPYARAIAGLATANEYDVSARSFMLQYSHNTSIEKPTEIYLSPLVYPNASYNVTVSGDVQWRVDPIDSNIILVEPIKQRIDSREKSISVMMFIGPKD
jgi:hypothetical protein